MQNSTKTWLRWIAVVPGALLAALLVAFPLHWLLYLAFAHNGTLLGFIELPEGANISIEHAVYPFVIALTFVLVGFEIAPAHKFKVAAILTALYAIFEAGVLLFAMNTGLQVSFGARSIGPVLGLILGLYLSWQNSRRSMSVPATP